MLFCGQFGKIENILHVFVDHGPKLFWRKLLLKGNLKNILVMVGTLFRAKLHFKKKSTPFFFPISLLPFFLPFVLFLNNIARVEAYKKQSCE